MSNKLIIYYFLLIIIIVYIFNSLILKRSIRGLTIPFKLRGVDKFGSGAFGAPRSHGKSHKGLDIQSKNDSAIYAPFYLEFSRVANPYSGSSYSGALYKSRNGYLKIFYMSPIKSKKTFAKGDIIGYTQNIQGKYGTGMKNHIHVQMYNKEGKIINPTIYVM